MGALSGRAGAQEPTDPVQRGAWALGPVHVIPMDRDTVLRDRTVLVRDGRIVDLAPSDAPVPEGFVALDGAGAYVFPGLIDLHAHPTDRFEFPVWLSWGVTGVQYLNAFSDVVDWQAEIARGELLGPRLEACDGPLVGLADSAAVEATLAASIERGFTCIKPYDDIEPTAYRLLIARAHELGLRVVGHIPRNLAWQDMVAARPDAVAHAEELLYSPLATMASIDSLATGMAEGGVAIVTTLVNYDLIARQALDPGRVPTGSELPYYSPVDRRYWGREHNGYVERFSPPARLGSLRRLLGVQRRLLARLGDAGVTLLAGTDAGNTFVLPGVSLHGELEQLVAVGLSPYEALAAATRDAARWLGWEDAGTLAAGMRADFVMVPGNPLDDVAEAALVEGVMIDGRWLDASEITARREEVRRRFEREAEFFGRVERSGVAALADAPTGADALRVRALNEWAYQVWKIEDDRTGAIEIFRANVERHSGSWIAWASLADALSETRPEEARRAYDRAIELAPERQRAELRRGRAQLPSGRTAYARTASTSKLRRAGA